MLLSNLDYATLIVGFLAPLVIAKVQAEGWPSWAKGLSAFGFEVGAALLLAIAGGTLQGDFGRCVLEVVGASIVGYQARWKPAMPELRIGQADMSRPLTLATDTIKRPSFGPAAQTDWPHQPLVGPSPPVAATPMQSVSTIGNASTVGTISAAQADELIAALQRMKGGQV